MFPRVSPAPSAPCAPCGSGRRPEASLRRGGAAPAAPQWDAGRSAPPGEKMGKGGENHGNMWKNVEKCGNGKIWWNHGKRWGKSWEHDEKIWWNYKKIEGNDGKHLGISWRNRGKSWVFVAGKYPWGNIQGNMSWSLEVVLESVYYWNGMGMYTYYKHPNWLSYCSEGLKPPTICIYIHK